MEVQGDIFGIEKPVNNPDVIILFNASSRNQIEKFNQIIARCESLDITELVNCFNCLHVAARKGHLDMVKRIHTLYPTIVTTRTSDNQRSSLMLAAFEGHEKAVEYLSDFESSTDVDAAGNNALHYACWGGNLSIVKALIEKKNFNPSLTNKEGLGAIQFATAGKHVNIVRYLSEISSGSLLSESSGFGFNSLHRAAISGSLETIKLLLSESINPDGPILSVDSRAHNGNSVMHLAAQYGSLEIVLYLIEQHDSQVNIQNDYDLTPLHFACIGGHLDVVKCLIRNNANVHIRNSSGSTAMHLAAASGHHSVCLVLSNQDDIEIMALDSEGNSPIDAALSAGYKVLASKIALWASIELRAKKLLLTMTEADCQ